MINHMCNKQEEKTVETDNWRDVPLEEESFCELMALGEFEYKLPLQRTITTKVEKVYKENVVRLRADLQSVPVLTVVFQMHC